MSNYFKPKNAMGGVDYYRSIYSGLDYELYRDSILNGNLFRYNLKFQNYYLDKPVIKIKKVSFIPSKKVKKSSIN